MPFFTDQLHRTIFLESTPRRIVSLVPSQTELLATLGLDPVGITKFCIHPDSWFRTKPRVGGTKDIHAERIDALQPDLLLANKEENDRLQIEALAARYPVWVSDVSTLPSALDMIRSVGTLTGREQPAMDLAAEIDSRFAGLAAKFVHRFTSLDPNISRSPVVPPLSAFLPAPIPACPRTAYLIWRNPWMAAGGDTFIHDMLRRCGLINVFAEHTRYPSFELSALADKDCELVLLSSEPYPFREKHFSEISSALPNADIRLVDGELFSWYGSRLLQSPDYFNKMFFPSPSPR
jgi:ABC-type Fe3+-hydroxamate transport system substrate-binding protein